MCYAFCSICRAICDQEPCSHQELVKFCAESEAVYEPEVAVAAWQPQEAPTAWISALGWVEYAADLL